MSESAQIFPEPGTGLEKMVRACLESEARDTDAAAMLAALRSRLSSETAAGPKLPPSGRSLWTHIRRVAPWGFAASLLLAVFLLFPSEKAEARPDEVVGWAIEAHALAVDRHYLVQAELSPALQKRFPAVAGTRQTHLWTRGDRFFVDMGEAGIWGHDEQGRVWLAPSRDAGVRFNADEVPGPLESILAVRSVRWVTLLEKVLNDCDLVNMPAEADRTDQPHRVMAVPRDGHHPLLRSAEIAVDLQTHEVWSMILHRSVFGGDVATVSYTLADREPQADDRYTAEGHLKPKAPVYDRSTLFKRRAFLVRHFGALLLGKQP